MVNESTNTIQNTPVNRKRNDCCSAEQPSRKAWHTAVCSAKERTPWLNLHAADCSAGRNNEFERKIFIRAAAKKEARGIPR